MTTKCHEDWTGRLIEIWQSELMLTGALQRTENTDGVSVNGASLM